MLTNTTETALRALIFISLNGEGNPITPRFIADSLDLSSTYLAKVSSQLVKSGILESHRGARGGVRLRRSPDTITLLEVIEACQGRLVGDYCDGVADPQHSCAFHQAMLEAYSVLCGVLSRWTLADLVAKPAPTGSEVKGFPCRMGQVCLMVNDADN